MLQCDVMTLRETGRFHGTVWQARRGKRIPGPRVDQRQISADECYKTYSQTSLQRASPAGGLRDDTDIELCHASCDEKRNPSYPSRTKEWIQESITSHVIDIFPEALRFSYLTETPPSPHNPSQP
jgi:hypothetical protein